MERREPRDVVEGAGEDEIGCAGVDWPGGGVRLDGID
jgi:hypothetical protein